MDSIPNHSRSPVESGALHVTRASADEINLYDELLTFSELSPQERCSEADHFVEQQERQPHTERESLRTQPLTQVRSENEPGQTQPLTHDEYEPHADADATDEIEPQEVSSALHHELQSTTEFGDSGPFGAMSSEFQYTGALFPGVCLGCGAESGADDLFCITCGAFVDESDSTVVSKLVCGECGLDSCADEIFCPECGAVVTG